MKIRVTKKTRQLLGEYSQYEETINGTVNRLLDSVEAEMLQQEANIGNTLLNVDKATADRIKSLAVRKGESYDDILARALTLVEKV